MLWQSASGSSGYSSFESDPAEPVTNLFKSSGAHDYRQLATRKDVLTFDSAAMESDLEVTGPIRAEVFLSCDCRDLDIWVHVLDVAPDGTAFNLMSPGLDVLRASYRKGTLEPDYVNGITKLTMDRMLTSNTFLAGHRIRVQFSGAFAPHFSRNLQTGSSEIKNSRRFATSVRIFHSKKHPSRIVLPVIPR
jgi:putative CocE/NonD family hydrolase